MKFEWEYIEREEDYWSTCRAKIHGGWIIKHNMYSEVIDDGSYSVSNSMVFVPDPHHCWSIDDVD